MLKTIILILLEIIAVAGIYCFVLWLLNLLFISDDPYTAKQIIIQGIVFSIIWVTLSHWWRSREEKKKQ